MADIVTETQALNCRCNPPGKTVKCPEPKCGYLCLFLQSTSPWVWPGVLKNEVSIDNGQKLV